MHSYAGDFICFTAFHRRDVRDVGDFMLGRRDGETVSGGGNSLSVQES